MDRYFFQDHPFETMAPLLRTVLGVYFPEIRNRRKYAMRASRWEEEQQGMKKLERERGRERERDAVVEETVENE